MGRLIGSCVYRIGGVFPTITISITITTNNTTTTTTTTTPTIIIFRPASILSVTSGRERPGSEKYRFS